MVLTSRYTMDARNPAARREIAALRRPGRGDPAAQRGASAGRRDRRGDRPAGPAPPRAGPRARPGRVGAGPADRDRRRAGRRSTSTSWPTRRRCSASWARPAACTGPTTWWSAPRGDTVAALAAALDTVAAAAGPRGLTWAPPALSAEARAGPPAPTARSAEPGRVHPRLRRRDVHRGPRRCRGAARGPPQPGRGTARAAGLARHRARARWTPSPPPPTTRRRSPGCART